MTVTDHRPVNFTNLMGALDRVLPGETLPNVELLPVPEVETIGELLYGTTTPALQRERIIGAIMGLLEGNGIPRAFAAVVVEGLLHADPARTSVVRNRIRNGLESLKEAAETKRAEFKDLLFRRLDDHMPKTNRRNHKVDREGILTSTVALAESGGIPEEEWREMAHDYVVQNLGHTLPEVVKWANNVRMALWLPPSYDESKRARTEGWKAGRNATGAHWRFAEALDVWGDVMTEAERSQFAKRSWLSIMSRKGPTADELNPSPAGAPKVRPADHFDPASISAEDLRAAFLASGNQVMDDHQRYPTRATWHPKVRAAVTDDVVEKVIRNYVTNNRWSGPRRRPNAERAVALNPHLDLTKEMTELTVRGVNVLDAVMTVGPKIPASLRAFVRDQLDHGSYQAGPWLDSIDLYLGRSLPRQLAEDVPAALADLSADELESSLGELRVAVHQTIALRDRAEQPTPWWEQSW